MRTKFIAGNWKMYKTTAEALSFAEEFKKFYDPAKTNVKTAICAPFTQLDALAKAFAGSAVGVGAQNMHFADEGAFTGEISLAMLKEVGVGYCVIGHSERREYFGETDETVNKKLIKIFESDIIPILCVGEKLETRDAGKALEFVGCQIEADLAGLSKEQVSKMVIAYEPIWAIGTGRTATAEQAEEMCAHIRGCVAALFGGDTAEELIIQYGGSVKPANAKELMNMPNIDGALVGGASLKAADFIQIVNY